MKIGIITDIHENTARLNTALRLAESYGCDELACLGDITGYDSRFYRYSNTRSAKECVNIVRLNFRWIVAGNHDLFAARKIPAYSNGFEFPPDWFEMDPEKRKKAAKGKVWSHEYDDPNDLGESDIEFIRSLPEFVTAEADGLSCLFSHYIYPDFSGSTTRYVERNHQTCLAWDFLEARNITYSFSGHSHQAFAGFSYKSGGNYLKAIHTFPGNRFNLGNNPVIVILPPLSGEQGRSGFSIVDTESRTVSIITDGF